MHPVLDPVEMSSVGGGSRASACLNLDLVEIARRSTCTSDNPMVFQSSQNASAQEFSVLASVFAARIKADVLRFAKTPRCSVPQPYFDAIPSRCVSRDH